MDSHGFCILDNGNQTVTGQGKLSPDRATRPDRSLGDEAAWRITIHDPPKPPRIQGIRAGLGTGCTHLPVQRSVTAARGKFNEPVGSVASPKKPARGLAVPVFHQSPVKGSLRRGGFGAAGTEQPRRVPPPGPVGPDSLGKRRRVPITSLSSPPPRRGLSGQERCVGPGTLASGAGRIEVDGDAVRRPPRCLRSGGRRPAAPRFPTAANPIDRARSAGRRARRSPPPPRNPRVLSLCCFPIRGFRGGRRPLACLPPNRTPSLASKPRPGPTRCCEPEIRGLAGPERPPRARARRAVRTNGPRQPDSDGALSSGIRVPPWLDGAADGGPVDGRLLPFSTARCPESARPASDRDG